MKSKKIASAFLILTMASSSVHAAGLQNMWTSNVTSGGSVTTKNRSGYVGGSASFRTPIKSVELFNYSAPRVSAGCSGADIYMGSFSYINGDQIVQTLETIMQNAQGLLFQAAIEFVSPMISGLMKDFNNLAQKINNQAINSCEIATSMMGPAITSARAYGNFAGAKLAELNTISDWLGLKTNGGTTPNDKLKDVEKIIPMMGNKTWKGLLNAGSGKKLDLAMFPVPADATKAEQYQNEILMSFLGTQITTSDDAISDGAQNATEASERAHSPDWEPLLDFYKLFDGGKAAKKYTCDEYEECKKPSVEDLSFVDAYTYVDVMLYGDPGWLSLGTKEIRAKLNDSSLITTVNNKPIKAHEKSIVAIVAGANTANKTLTAEQQNFLNFARSPIIQMLIDLQGDEYDNILTLTEMIKTRIALHVVADISDSVIAVTANMQTARKRDASGNVVAGNVLVVEIPEHLRARRTFLEEQSKDIKTMLTNTAAQEKEAREWVNTIIKARAKIRNGR